MQTFALSVLGSLVVAVIYGLFFSHREDQIRAYLKRTRAGLLKRLYVKALVGAIRGASVIALSRQLAFMTVATWGAFYLVGLSTIIEGQQAMRAGERILREDEQQLRLSEDAVREAELWLLKGDPEPETVEESRRKLQARLISLREVQKKWQGTEQELRESTKEVEDYVFYGKIVLNFVMIVVYIASYIWLPYVVMRSRFSYEISRFSLRIQGLASKSELAALTAAETSVRDVETLKVYVMLMKQVSTRHGIPELTRTFELWDS